MVLHPAQAYSIIFLTGGFVYCGIEIIYRGFSHISMFLAGGICFLLIGWVERASGTDASLIAQMFCCALIITAVEFVFGIVVNRQMHLNVWDYSQEQYNFMGQICLLNSCLWFLLSCPAIYLNDLLQHWLLGVPLFHHNFF